MRRGYLQHARDRFSHILDIGWLELCLAVAEHRKGGKPPQHSQDRHEKRIVGTEHGGWTEQNGGRECS